MDWKPPGLQRGRSRRLGAEGHGIARETRLRSFVNGYLAKRHDG